MQSNLDALKPAALWVPVKIVPKPGKPGKTDKIPCNLDGYQVDAQNTTNWMTWWEADAIRHFLQLRPGESTGVGLVIRPESGLFCVDLDDCIQGDRLSDLALGMIEALPGVLMERSHSGRGLHLWGYAPTIDPEHRTRSTSCPALEVYTRGRFILVTEDFCGGWLDDHSAALDAMATALLGPPVQHVEFEWSDSGLNDHLSDEQIIERVRAHRIRTASGTFRTGACLWDCVVDELSTWYPSSTGGAYDGSGADLALATLLMAHTGNNADRSWRLLCQSGLARGKHYRDDYRQWTIQRAYRPDLRPAVRPEKLPWAVAPAAPVAHNEGSAAPLAPQPSAAIDVRETEPNRATIAPWSVPRWPPGTFLSDAEIAEHFRGCVYVTALDKIYCPDGTYLNERQFNAKFSGSGVMFKMTADNKVSRKAWEAYHGSECFEPVKVDRTVFNPSEPAGAILDGAVNTWVPPVIPMVEGDVSPYLDLLQRQLPDERDRRILLSWMAAAVQHRDVKFRWSPYIQGAKGNGKTTHLTVMEYCMGVQYTCRPAADKMGKQFNAIYDRKLMVCVDDINMAGHNALWDKLKPMITEDIMEIEVKGVDSSCVRDMRNKYMFTSNEQAGLPVSSDERRLAPLFTAQQEHEDLVRDGMGGDYFVRLHKWLGSGPGGHKRGLAAVAHYLMHYPIDPEFNPAGDCQRAPVTTGTAIAIAKSRTGIERHVQDAIQISKELAPTGEVTHLQMQMFYRKHGQRMPDITECTELLREFGLRWDGCVTWKRAVAVPPVP